MRPATHIAQGTLAAAALYPFWGGQAVLFGLAVILIDLDHVIEYLWDTRDWSLRGFFVYNEVLYRNLQANILALNLFHTLEFYLLGGVLSLWFPLCIPIVAGCMFHHLFDLIGLYRIGHPRCKAFSIIEYALRRKGHALSIRDVMRHRSTRIDGIEGAEEWLTRWGIRTVPGEAR